MMLFMNSDNQYLNKLGLVKSKIGEIFKSKHEKDLKLNISNRRKDLILRKSG